MKMTLAQAQCLVKTYRRKPTIRFLFNKRYVLTELSPTKKLRDIAKTIEKQDIKLMGELMGNPNLSLTMREFFRYLAYPDE